MAGLGWPEMVLILVLVLILFGPRRLPEVAEALGKSLKKFKSATSEATREVKRELDDAGRELRKEEPSGDEPGGKKEEA
ncbi:twin-arginine translocase TatA/TatE family subunit [bacterium]|nr:twin-arginine translocase TatA/TatE family subunit [bacterium]